MHRDPHLGGWQEPVVRHDPLSIGGTLLGERSVTRVSPGGLGDYLSVASGSAERASHAESRIASVASRISGERFRSTTSFASPSERPLSRRSRTTAIGESPACRRSFVKSSSWVTNLHGTGTAHGSYVTRNRRFGAGAVARRIQPVSENGSPRQSQGARKSSNVGSGTRRRNHAPHEHVGPDHWFLVEVPQG